MLKELERTPEAAAVSGINGRVLAGLNDVPIPAGIPQTNLSTSLALCPNIGYRLGASSRS